MEKGKKREERERRKENRRKGERVGIEGEDGRYRKQGSERKRKRKGGREEKPPVLHRAAL